MAFHIWSVSRIPIKNIDRTQKIVTLTGSTAGTPWFTLGSDNWYRLENVAESDRSPGDWYLDRSTWQLEYTPLTGEDVSSAEIIAPRLPWVMRILGDSSSGKYAEHLHFRGITFAHNNWNVPSTGHSVGQGESDLDGAISAKLARHVLLENCVVRHTGTYGVNFGAGCSDCRLESTELFDLAAGGVKLGSWDTEFSPNLWSSNCVVRDCLIGHGGRVHPAGIGVWIGFASSNIITHNEVLDFYQCGISAGWTWRYGSSPAHDQLLTYNLLHHLGQGVTSDLGGIYTLGDNRGSIEASNVTYIPWVGSTHF